MQNGHLTATIIHISNGSGFGACNCNENGRGYILAVRIISGTIMALVIAIAVLGNLVVLAAVVMDHRLRTNCNMFIASLAVADLMLGLLIMPISLSNEMNQHWQFGELFCMIWIALDSTFSTASIFNMFLISLNRYLQISRGIWYMTWLTRRKTVASILILWSLSALLAFTPIVFRTHGSLKKHQSKSFCLPDLDLNPLLALSASAIFFYIPCCGIIYFYLHIYVYAHRHAKAIQLARMAVWKMNHKESMAAHSKTFVTGIRAAKSLGLLVGAFLLCWVPFFTFILISIVCKRCFTMLAYKTTTWLGYANSAINPIIYSVVNTGNFRRVVLNIILHRNFPRSNTSVHPKQ